MYLRAHTNIRNIFMCCAKKIYTSKEYSKTKRNYRKQPNSLIAAMVSFVSLPNRDDADNSFSDFDTVGLPLQWCMIIIQGLCLYTHIESGKGQGTIRFDGNFWFFGRIDTLDHTINATIRLVLAVCKLQYMLFP